MVAEVNDQALLGADVHRLGQLERRRPAGLDALPDLVETVFQFVGGVRAQGEDAAGGGGWRVAGGGFSSESTLSLTLSHRARGCVPLRLSSAPQGHTSILLRPLRQHPRHVLFHHQMEVRAAEAVGADAGAAGGTVARCPFAGFVDQVEGRVGEVNVGVGRVGVERRRQDFVVQRQGRLQQAGRARPGLQVADVALGRAEADAAARRAAEGRGQALHLDHVADAGAGAVGLDQGGRGRV